MLLHVWRARVKNRIQFHKTLSLIMCMINSVSEPFSLLLARSLSLSFPRNRIQHVRSIYRPILFWLISLNVLSVCRCVLLLLHSLHAF